MNYIENFLKELAIQGVFVWADGEQLRYKAPKQHITSSLLNKLKKEKPAILSWIHEIGCYAPLSQGQKALWFVNQANPNSSAYNVPMPLRLHLKNTQGRIDSSRLKDSISAVVARHTSLNTVFATHDGIPVQKIFSQQTLDWEEIDVTGWSMESIMDKVDKLNQQPFDLATGPLLRVTFLNRTDLSKTTPPILLFVLHHIICDDWSTEVFLNELCTLYQSELTTLPPVKQQYTDYIHYQNELLAKEGEKLVSYWSQQLSGELPVLNLPTDYPRPPILQEDGASHPFTLSSTLSQQLVTLAKREGVTLYTLLFAAFQLFLHRYTGQDDILTGSPTSGARYQDEFAETVGYFVNPIVLRTTLAQYDTEQPTFSEFLRLARQVVLEGISHQDYPFPLLVQQLELVRDPSRSPLFQSFFIFQNLRRNRSMAENMSGLQIEAIDMPQMEGQFELILVMEEEMTEEKSLIGTFKYNIELFKPATIMRMAEQWETLLTSIVHAPTAPIATLPLLPQHEAAQILVEWNTTQRAYPDTQCFHQLFEAQVANTPYATAAIFVDDIEPGLPGDEQQAKQITYDELNRQSNQLAHYLQNQGVGPECVVGLYAERSLEMVIGLLGIFKAGGAYLPLDPTYPPERLAFMMEDAEVSLVLTQSRFLADLPETVANAQIITLDKDWPLIALESDENPVGQATPEQLAYLIYTSGSTGKPKGVLVEHRGLTNLAVAQIRAFGVEPESRVLQVASFNFDASISEIAMALGAGAVLYLASPTNLMPGPNLAHLLQSQAITHVTLTPPALAMLSPETVPDLQTLIVAGEACSAELVKHWAVGRRFFNAYGPTENSVCATIMECTGTIYEDGHCPPPIGRAMDNVQLFVLDPNLQPVPIGVPGELYIGGVGVARGYLNRPELTAQRFIELDPQNMPSEYPIEKTKRPQRLYKTGDLVRYLPDGNLEFLDRIDQQVKVRGYRIELGEIETLIKAYPSIQDSAVVVQGEGAARRLVAYWVSEPDTATNADALRLHLADKLPEYMLPALWVPLEQLPLTPNGKVDRQSLSTSTWLPLQTEGEDGEKQFVAPRNKEEEALALLWAEVLQLPAVGVRDEFFTLGGHSLLAIQLLKQIEQQYGQRIAIEHFLQGATVEKMALVLSQSNEVATSDSAWSPLVAIQSAAHGSTFHPLFCIHPVGGNVFCYRELANALGSEQPVYGLQAVGLENGQTPFTDIEEMAAYYCEAIGRVQPHGPYYLAGWSLGGVIAFAMAQKWAAEGERVELLALIDSYIASDESDHQTLIQDAQDEAKLWSYFQEDLAKVVGNELPLDEIDLSTLSHASSIASPSLEISGASTDVALQSIHQWWRLFYANTQALASYKPMPSQQPICLFTAESHPNDDHGWCKLAKNELVTYKIGGDHYTILQEPQVQKLAEYLKTHLDSAPHIG